MQVRVLASCFAFAGWACASSTAAEIDAGPAAPPPVDGTIFEGPDAAPSYVPMYAHTRDTLYRVDGVTLDIIEIGPFDSGTDYITDLAVATDGTLYGVSETKLFRIDAVTGHATYVAPVAGETNVGMTFLPDGKLLATDKQGGVRRIDPVAGAVTEIGAFGGGYATAGDLVAVADGTMYAISDEGPSGDEYDNNVLLTVQTSTGVASPVGQIGFGAVFGCAYANGHVYAFTRDGDIIEIDRTTGAGDLRRTHPVQFWGAGVSPLVVIE